MQGIQLFTFKGIPVSFHPSFLLLVFILSIGMGELVSCVIFGICAIFGVLFHEFGHALVARHYNLGPSIMLQGLGGITSHAKSASPKQDFLITLAGPIAGLIIGGTFYGLLVAASFVPSFAAVLMSFPVIRMFIQYTAWVNLLWGVFNLIPIIPMDGSKVLNYIFRKFFGQTNAGKISAVLSIILLAGVLAWSLFTKNVWMIVLSFMFIMINYSALKSVFRNPNAGPNLKQAGIAAERAYERGLTAAREHDWKQLEICGNQMKRAANDMDQLGRAYEFLTIAATNQYKYEEALKYAENARQSDAVKQAVARCKKHLSLH